MFNSEAKYLNNLFNLIWKIILILFSITLGIIFLLNIFEIIKLIPDALYIDRNNPWMKLLTNSLFFGLIFMPIGFVYVISSLFIKKKCIKLYADECKQIIKSTTLPKNLPKVLYIYTCHNDLIEARVLQNLKQTYKNFELWVSDGSSSEEWRNKIKLFCNKNNINLFQIGGSGSKNKADNLNHFLKQYKNEYDYLLIGDADEVFNENFVENAIKIFVSKKIKNLSYITPLNVNYRSKGIYPNVSRILETTAFTWTLFSKNFNNYNLAPIAGQSCLISRESIIECNGDIKFDEGNLEDWYLESMMVENSNYGIMLPNSLCFFEADVNIKAHFNRIMRIEDWRIRWWKIRKKKILWNYNERYNSWYQTYFQVLIRPLGIFFGLFLFSLFIWIIVEYWNPYFNNNSLFWIWFGFTILLTIIILLTNSLLIWRINFNLCDYIIFPIFLVLWLFVANIKVSIHWFKSLFLGKYSQFGGSGSYRFFKTKSQTLSWWIWFLILSIMIIAFNLSIFTLTNWWTIKWLIILFNVYFGVIYMGVFSYLILWYVNFIPYNSSFNREDWIECKELF